MKPRRGSSISNPEPRPVPGNAQGRASEFYKGTTQSGSKGRKKKGLEDFANQLFPGNPSDMFSPNFKLPSPLRRDFLNQINKMNQATRSRAAAPYKKALRGQSGGR